MSEHVLVTDDAGFPALINGDKPVIVDFWAEWCPPCRAIAPVLDKMAGENPQVITAKINVDQSQASAAKYGARRWTVSSVRPNRCWHNCLRRENRSDGKQHGGKPAYAAEIEYAGKNYAGWQIQPNALTVQQVLQDALKVITGRDIKIKAASRTDAGVHARGQLAVIDVPAYLVPDRLQKGLNALTPPDIGITYAAQVSADFNLRTEVTAKEYIYVVHCGNTPPVLDREYCRWLRKYPSAEKMREIIPLLTGRHDFHAFRAANCGSPNTVKTLESICISEEPYGESVRITLKFVGNGFLKNMVRIMVGSITDYALGKIPKAAFEAALTENGTRDMLGMTAPPEGLTLHHIYTRKPLQDYRINAGNHTEIP
ncbi:hypothetical protein CHS0354_026784 [Potamilus streckersoni]|uniref:tRNA pseudouridine synthase n=1 Tax=Potamilus streckersoni TaxID=2493646 RepID=A0AAE0W6J5_9BIVA|nr:hypothetical protein CHS0354_026784 [Potamilus streckersoni]